MRTKLLSAAGVLVVVVGLIISPEFMFQWSGVMALVCFALVGALWFARRYARTR